MRHKDRYFCPAPMLLDWAIQPLFESTLKQVGGRTWERYHGQRHDFVLDTAVRLLSDLMPACDLETRLFYDVDKQQGRQAELDALGVYDSVLFLVEAKGQDVTDPSRRGAPARLHQDLKGIIAQSHQQALRAKDYIGSAKESSEPARFRKAEDRSEVMVPVAQLRDVLLLSVTLAPIAHLTAQLHAESSLGLFESGEYSWVVNIYDLMVIAEILDLPAAFPHYATRRSHTARLGLLEAPEELDIFGYYLLEGLYLDNVADRMRTESGVTKLRLLSYTGPFDDYYLYATGRRRTKATKPTQEIPRHLRELIDGMEASCLPGFLTVAMAMLDLDGEGRAVMARHIQRAQEITKSKRRASNASLAGRGDGGWGITYWSDVSDAQVASALKPYCSRKQAEIGAKRWFGVGEVIRKDSRQVVCVVV